MITEVSADCQTRMQKAVCFFTGLGGISLKFADVANLAQQIGAIVGCILVCGQAFIFFRGFFKRWRRNSPVNDS